MERFHIQQCFQKSELERRGCGDDHRSLETRAQPNILLSVTLIQIFEGELQKVNTQRHVKSSAGLHILDQCYYEQLLRGRSI